MLPKLVCLIFGYLVGMISPAVIYARAKGIDIRSEGSGNAGTTNVLRVLGKKAGVIVFLGDVLKAAVSCMLMGLIFSDVEGLSSEMAILYTWIGVILGHCFPFYLSFKGGKGIACTFGAILILNHWIAIVCFGCFLVIAFVTKTVSIASLISNLLLLVLWILFFVCGWLGNAELSFLETFILFLIQQVIVIYKHKDNIVRIINGRENKFGFK